LGDIELAQNTGYPRKTGASGGDFSACWRFPSAVKSDNSQWSFTAFLPFVDEKEFGRVTCMAEEATASIPFPHGNWEFAGAVLQSRFLTNCVIGLEVYHQTEYQNDFPKRRHGV